MPSAPTCVAATASATLQTCAFARQTGAVRTAPSVSAAPTLAASHVRACCIDAPRPRAIAAGVCPYGRAFVDTAQGDLNGDGVLSPPPARFITQEFPDGSLGTFELFPDFRKGEAHGYMECSNAGRCDRTSGTCRCFTGYAGHACQRSECAPPGGTALAPALTDASLQPRAQAAAAGMACVAPSRTWGSATPSATEPGMRVPCAAASATPAMAAWTATGVRGWRCAVVVASLTIVLTRAVLCPRGADPVTAAGGVDEVQLLNLAAENPGARGTFVLDFTDTFGFEWHTRAIEVDAGKPVTSAASVRGALLAIPNDAIVNVNVTGESAGNALQIKVTFTHTSGDVALLRVRDVQMMDGLGVPVTASVVELVKGTKLSAECSNRGLCDYMLGLCRCFKGFFTHDCSKQSALSR